jgi:hypothetical protein
MNLRPNPKLKQDLDRALRQFVQVDLRLSYLAIGGMVLLGAAVNILLPHGWTVWPFVLGAAIMLFVNEAADRNGQGVPPLHAYAFVGGAMAFWFLVILLFSVLNFMVLVLGMLVLGYYWARGYMRIRQRAQLVASRRMEGRCIHCGQIADPQYAFCQNCGEDPDPDATLLKNIANVPRSSGSAARARAALKPDSHAASATKKEQALINRRRTAQHRRR